MGAGFFCAWQPAGAGSVQANLRSELTPLAVHGKLRHASAAQTGRRAAAERVSSACRHMLGACASALGFDLSRFHNGSGLFCAWQPAGAGSGQASLRSKLTPLAVHGKLRHASAAQTGRRAAAERVSSAGCHMLGACASARRDCALPVTGVCRCMACCRRGFCKCTACCRRGFCKCMACIADMARRR